MQNKFSHSIWIGIAAAASAVAPPAFAKESDESFWIRVEGYRPQVNSLVRVGSVQTGQEGTLIDLEEDLALSKRKTLPSLAAGFALDNRWQVDAEYYALSRQDQVQLSREINFDGAVYPLNATIESEFNSDVYRLSVGYLIAKGPRHQFGASIGAHVTQFTAGIEGQATVPGGGLQLASRRRKVLAPLPTLGLFGSFEPLPRVVLGAQADYLSLKVDDYRGRLLNIEASAAYRLNKTLSIGLGYRKVDYRLRIEKALWTGKVNYNFNGPSIFMRAAF
jgi:hypothetical protein